MVAVELPDVMSGLITFENMLPVSVLEWLVLLVPCKIKGKIELEPRKSKNSLV